MFLGTPAPVGFGYSEYIVAGAYATPMVGTRTTLLWTVGLTLNQVAVVIGEVIGRFGNDWIMNTSIRRNHGFFEAESRLWCVHLN